MVKKILPILFALIGICPTLIPAVAVGGAKAEINVRSPAQWISASATPVFIDVFSPRGAVLSISMTASRHSNRTFFPTQKTMSIPPGIPVQIEMTAGPAFSSIDFTFKGLELETRQSIPTRYFNYRDENAPLPVICVNNFMVRELTQFVGEEGDSPISSQSLPMQDLPTLWQSYLGFMPIVVIDSAEMSALRPKQREAMVRWIRWLGGRLWLSGDNSVQAAKDLGIDISALTGEMLGDVMRYQVVNGWLYIQNKPNINELIAYLPVTKPSGNPLQDYININEDYYHTTPAAWLMQPFAGVSTVIIISILIVLCLVMGPLNLWYVYRKKNSLLFFITTPLIAVIGTLSIFAASLFSEGFGGYYNQRAVLIHDPVSDEAILFDARGVKSGFFVSSLRFAETTMALPIYTGKAPDELAIDSSNGIRLTAGWLQPRFSTGYLIANPVVSRMNLEVVAEGDDYFLHNEIGFEVMEVAAMLPDGNIGLATSIKPGERARLSRTPADNRLRSLSYSVAEVFGDSRAFAKFSLVARCAGLPYLDDGELTAEPVKRDFYYCVPGANDAGAGDE